MQARKRWVVSARLTAAALDVRGACYSIIHANPYRMRC